MLTQRELEHLLQDAQRAHHLAERRLPDHDWTTWYATYILSRHGGRTLDDAALFADREVYRRRPVPEYMRAVEVTVP